MKRRKKGKELCEKCQYRGHISGGMCCNYILIEKKRRKIEKGYCYEFKEGKKIQVKGE